MQTSIKIAFISATAVISAAVISGIIPSFLKNTNASETKIINNNGSQNSPSFQDVNIVNVYNQKVNQDERTNKNLFLNASKNLKKIFIGAGRKYIENLFGIPIIEINHKVFNVIEVNYSFENFYLQFLYNERGEVQFYSVTSKNKSFKPNIPIFDMPLGEYTFNEYGNKSTYIYSYLTSKHYGYAESMYLGNSGNYHNYYFGYNSAGVDYGNIYPFTDNNNKAELDKFRQTCIPNTFGIGDIGKISDDKLHYEMGIEYYTSRDIN